MCGRYIIISGQKIFATTELLKTLHEQQIPYLEIPRYNAAPTQKLPIVVQREKNEPQPLEAVWWLIPHWSKDGNPDMKFASFNARAEGIAESKLFGKYFKARRCLIPADGFYEWKKISEKEKHPMCIRRRDEQPFFFAGVYSVWKNNEAEKEKPSFSIITTTPNELMSEIHNRMPVILHKKNYEEWLDPSYNDTDALKKLLVPFPSEKMKAYRVSPYVSNSKNQGRECMEPLKEN